jgi:hypothetical protein
MTKETIARYETQFEIGRGGMATVYLANDPNFRRKVTDQGREQSQKIEMLKHRFVAVVLVG